jgi:glyoxylase-like metal-dependent hydrolase (beta-lactamase superfamily II)
MRVIEIGPGVHHVAASNCGFGIVTEGSDVTLVDCGYPGDRDLLLAALEHLGHGPGDVEALLLTHAHVDHLGSAEWLRREHGVPVHCLTGEAAHARGEREEVISAGAVLVRAWRPGVFSFLVNFLRKDGKKLEHPAEVETFGDGAVIDVPGRPRVVHTPGHTSGHVGFHLPDRGVLVTGDALITTDVWNHADRGPQLIAEPFNHDHSQAISSLHRYAELEAEVLLPGHGEPWSGSPAQAVHEALARLG